MFNPGDRAVIVNSEDSRCLGSGVAIEAALGNGPDVKYLGDCWRVETTEPVYAVRLVHGQFMGCTMVSGALAMDSPVDVFRESYLMPIGGLPLAETAGQLEVSL